MRGAAEAALVGDCVSFCNTLCPNFHWLPLELKLGAQVYQPSDSDILNSCRPRGEHLSSPQLPNLDHRQHGLDHFDLGQGGENVTSKSSLACLPSP